MEAETIQRLLVRTPKREAVMPFLMEYLKYPTAAGLFEAVKARIPALQEPRFEKMCATW
jgi:hypothetical protein